MITVPFRASRQEMDGHRISVHEARGLVRLEAVRLEFEFREHLQEFGEVTYRERAGSLRIVSVPLDHLSAVRWKGGLGIRPRIKLEFSHLSAAEALPFAVEAGAGLRVRWRDRWRGQDLAGEAALLLADSQLRSVERAVHSPLPTGPARHVHPSDG